MGSGVGVTSKAWDLASKYAFLSFGSFFHSFIRQFSLNFFKQPELVLVPKDRVGTGIEFIVEFFLISLLDIERIKFFGRNLSIFHDF